MINKRYSGSQEQALISYDYTDFAEGAGIKTFYLVYGSNNGGVLPLLTPNVFYSRQIELTYTESIEAANMISDVDYDLATFNMPQVIGGTAYFNFSMSILRSGSGGSGYGWLVIKVRKWDGTTETEIANVTTESVYSSGSASEQYLEQLTPLTIPTTHFKAGEKLRITIEGWGSRTSTASTYAVTYGTDPADRDGTHLIPSSTNHTTQFKCYIPFRIDT